jgi:hypothetical protein
MTADPFRRAGKTSSPVKVVGHEDGAGSRVVEDRELVVTISVMPFVVSLFMYYSDSRV